MSPDSPPPRRVSLLLVIALLAGTFLAAALGGFASANAKGFYSELVRPSWAPPAWLFGPVWTFLYLAMATAAILVARQPCGPQRSQALWAFAAQLALNALWPWTFFAWRQGGLAVVSVLVLLGAIGLTWTRFARVHRLASWLLVPYLAWVAFASALTIACWRLNPQLL